MIQFLPWYKLSTEWFNIDCQAATKTTILETNLKFKLTTKVQILYQAFHLLGGPIYNLHFWSIFASQKEKRDQTYLADFFPEGAQK